MIKRILTVAILVLIITSCDLFLSFLVSPVYNIPVFRAAWTVDNGNARIVGDPSYFSNSDPQSVEWQLGWNGINLLIPNNNNDYSYLTPLTGMPLEIKKFDQVNSPLFYLHLLFGYDFVPDGLDITVGAPPVPPAQTINLGRDGGSDINAVYTMTVNTLLGQTSYNLPEPAYLGIDGSGSITSLSGPGSLNIVNFNITADHDFVTGQATCVFSNSPPAGLLYMVYYHSNGLVSLLYAVDVETTATGVLFPDGRYEYIWSVYRNN